MRIFLILFFILSLGTVCVEAQAINTIRTRCPNPFGSSYGNITVGADGNINYWPCPTKSSIFHRGVDFSDATVILPGFVQGTGTTNFIPRWTNGAGSVIGNTPFSWNGATYAWNNTALTCTFCMSFVPGIGTGTFSVGDSNNSFSIDNVTGRMILKASAGLGVFISQRSSTHTWTNADATSNFTMALNLPSAGNGLFTVGNASAGTFVTVNEAGGSTIVSGASGATLTAPIVVVGESGAGTTNVNLYANTLIEANSSGGVFKAGDTQNASNGVLITVDDGSKQLLADSRASGVFNAGDINNVGSGTEIIVDDNTQRTTLVNGRGSVEADGANATVRAGDITGSVNGTLFTIDDQAQDFIFANAPIHLTNVGCAGVAMLDIAGQSNTPGASACWGLAAQPICLVTGQNTTGILTCDGVGLINSSVGGADNGNTVNYLIIDVA